MKKQLTIFECLRYWQHMAIEQPHRLKPNHAALWMSIYITANRKGWPELFDYTREEGMRVSRIGNHKTYSKVWQDLQDLNFIRVERASRNQHDSTVIAIVISTTALYKQVPEHLPEHSMSTDHGTVCISKPINNITYKPVNEVSPKKNEVIDLDGSLPFAAQVAAYLTNEHRILMTHPAQEAIMTLREQISTKIGGGTDAEIYQAFISMLDQRDEWTKTNIGLDLVYISKHFERVWKSPKVKKHNPFANLQKLLP